MTIMNISETTNYKTVLQIVHSWSPATQFALVQDILKSLAFELIPPRSQRNTLEQALGLLATDHPAPSDAEVAQWLAERRLEKYG
jgi:hypothetical protein